MYHYSVFFKIKAFTCNIAEKIQVECIIIVSFQFKIFLSDFNAHFNNVT